MTTPVGRSRQEADLSTAPDALLTEALEDRSGKMGGSLYETALVVRQCHRSPGILPSRLGRMGLENLLRNQNPDGSWGSTHVPPGYRLVPTLAAVATLLEITPEADGEPWPAFTCDRAGQIAAGRRGLEFLIEAPERFDPVGLPDFVAIDLIVPSLLADVQKRAPSRYRHRIAQAMWLQRANQVRLQSVRQAVARGVSIPEALVFSLEVLEAPPSPSFLDSAYADGSYALSPVVTALAMAWSGTAAPEPTAYLLREGERRDGQWPNAAPSWLFERAWMVGAFANLGVTIGPGTARRLVDTIASGIGPRGAAYAPGGLPADCDDTAACLYALHALGATPDPRTLLPYRGDGHFVTYLGESNPSVTTNSHALDAVTAVVGNGATDPVWVESAAGIQAFLLDSQEESGMWTDKWHASPYYATMCTATALTRAGAPGSAAVSSAVRWVRDTQREDGSWGRWAGTASETAYALHILLACGDDARSSAEAIQKGARFLLGTRGAGSGEAQRPPLWHCKELFEAERVETAYAVSALQAARSRWPHAL